MESSFSVSKCAQKARVPKVLFVYEDKRARYLLGVLKDKIDLIDVFRVEINRKEPFFWLNMLLGAMKMAYLMINKGVFLKKCRVPLNRPRAAFDVLFNCAMKQRRVIKEMSAKIEKHINSMVVKPDLVLLWSSMFAPYTGTAKIPFALIIDVYADPPKTFQRERLQIPWRTFYKESLYRFQRELYSRAINVFTLSKWCKEGLSKDYGIDPKKIVAIGWGPTKSIDRKNPSEKRDRSILAVGHNYLTKGFDVLIESAKYLKGFSITIVGKDSKAAFRASNIPENVKIMGYVSEETLVRLYSTSELFFLFSQFEPAGHVLWEAQAYGCVIVGYGAYGIAEAVINGQTGILLKTRDPILVAEEIRKLYQDRTRLEKMRKAAIENYRKNGTWGEVCNRIIRSLRIDSCD